MTLDEILSGYREASLLNAVQMAPLPTGPAASAYAPDRVVPSALGFLTDPYMMGDALRANNNLLTSTIDWMMLTSRLAEVEEEPGFDVLRDYNMKGIEQFSYQMQWARSRRQADILKASLIEDAATRRSFSEQGPWTQLLVGGAASVGPADMIPLASIPKGVLAAGLALGAATGFQSALRNSMALQPGTIDDVALDASMGMLFGSGRRALQRLSMTQGDRLEAWGRAADEADGPGVPPEPGQPPGGPTAGPRSPVAPIAPFVVNADEALPPLVPRDPLSSPRVMPGGDGLIEVPRGQVLERPFFIVDDKVVRESPGPIIDHRQPFVLDEPALSDGERLFPARRGPVIIADDVTARPFVISETDGNGVGTARQVPSAQEIITGRIAPDPMETRRVRVEKVDGPGEPAGEAATPGVKASIREESSAGAQQATQNVWRDEDSFLATAGGLERLGMTPAMRNLNSAIPDVRDTTAALVDHGMLQRGNFFGMASEQSVEARYYAMHASKLPAAIRGFWEDFAGYSQAGVRTGSRTVDFLLSRAKGAVSGTSYKQFMREVSAAVIDGGRSATNPAVASAAERFRGVTEAIRKEAADAGYWDRMYSIKIEELAATVAGIQRRVDEARARAATATGPEAAAAASRQANLEAELRRAQAHQATVEAEKSVSDTTGGPRPQGDTGYLPRYYRYDKIMAERSNVEAIFQAVIDAKRIRDPITNAPYTGREAVDILLNIDPHTGQPRPYVKGGGDSKAHSARERGFDWIGSADLSDYIEMDAEVLLRRYVRQMGIDIELTSRFGDPFMIDEIRRLSTAGASALELEDMMFMRDVLRGTHSPMDPTSILTHATQAAKIVANVTVLGGQTITAFTDLARPFMTEGFHRTFGETFNAISGGMSAVKLWRKEAEMLGSSAEMVQSIRAQAMANGNGAMAGTPAWLQKMEGFQSAYFMLNGIAPWTETMKTWQSIVTAGRMMDDIEKLAAGSSPSPAMAARLAKVGIDERNAGAIAAQISAHQVHMGRGRLPNIAHWDDLEAARVFRTAAWSAVNSSIVSPGAAHVSRWMVEGTSWLPPQAAQVISMYHSYGMALHQKLLVAGLQVPDATFLSGALSLVTLGYVVDHLRDEMNTVGDRKARTKTVAERLTSAVDRSGLTGYMANANNAIERLSFNTLGVRPFTGQVDFGSGTFSSALGGLGPVGGWAGNLYKLVNGTAHGREGWAEAQAFRRMLPMQNLFWLDGVFDKVQDSAHVPAAVTRERRRAEERVLAASAGAERAASRDDQLAGRILVEQGHIRSPDEALDVEGHIGRGAIAWDKQGRPGKLGEYLSGPGAR